MDFSIMKILFISNLYPPQYIGGYELRCKETADELIRRGHDVFVLTSKGQIENNPCESNIYRLLSFNSFSNSSASERIDKFRLRKRYFQLLGALQARLNYYRTRDLINQIQPDLVFAWSLSNIGITPVLACQDRGVPTVFSIGDYWLLELKKSISNSKNLLKRIYQSIINGLFDFSELDTRYMLVISTSLKQIYVENGFPNNNITVIPRGMRSNLIVASNFDQEPFEGRSDLIRLLFVGRLVTEKAPDIAIKAIDVLVKTYSATNVSLDIVGKGVEDYEVALRKLVSALRLENYVKFLGHLEHNSMLGSYSQYYALLFPSRWSEPLGGTILEAMARGLPVIASRRGGPLDIIEDDVNGLLVPVDNPEKLAEAIYRLVQDPDRANRIRVAALRNLRENFTLEKIVDTLLEYFQNVLNSDNYVAQV